jgi:hypothetical protein
MVDAYHLMRRAVPLKQLLLQSDAVIATVLQDNKAGMISLVYVQCLNLFIVYLHQCSSQILIQYVLVQGS